MEVKISSTCVTSVADITDDFSLFHKLTGDQSIGVALKMGVVKHQLLVRAELIDCRPPALALEEFYDLAIGSSHDRSSRRSRDIDSVMGTPFRTRSRKRVR